MSEFWEKCKAGFLYIAVPIAALLGYIYYLLTKKTELESKLERASAEKGIIDVITKKDEAKKSADELEHDFRDALRKHGYNDDGTGG